MAACCWSLDILCVPSLDPSDIFPCNRVFPHWGLNMPFLCIGSLCLFWILFWEPKTHLLCPNSHSCCCLWVYVNPVPQFAFLRQRSFTAYNSSPLQVSQCVRVYPVWVGLISQPWGARMPGSHRRQSSRCRTCAAQQRAGADLWGNEPGILVRATRAHRLMQERSLVTPWSRSPPQLNAMILLAPVGMLLTLPSHPVFWTFILVLLWNIFS